MMKEAYNETLDGKPQSHRYTLFHANRTFKELGYHEELKEIEMKLSSIKETEIVLPRDEVTYKLESLSEEIKYVDEIIGEIKWILNPDSLDVKYDNIEII